MWGEEGGRDHAEEQGPAAATQVAASDPLPGIGENGRLRKAVMSYEQKVIYDAIRIHGSKRKAARALGVNVSTLVRMIARIQE